MTQLEASYAQRVADAGSTTNASFTTIGTPTLASAAFVTGKKYLLLARCELGVNTLAAQGAVRLVHGSTVFDDSTQEFTPTVTLNDRSPYFFFVVWTAVAGEAISFQIRGNGTARCDLLFSSLTAIRLSDALTEGTDWHYVDESTDHTLTTTAVTGASLTFTPASAGNTWLILSRARLTFDFANDEFLSRLDRTGEAAANWEMVHGGHVVGDSRVLPMIWTGALGAVSQTFREQARRTGTGAATAVRSGSAVLALNLSKLDVASITQSDAHLDVASTAPYATEVGTVNHTQTVDGGRVLLLGYVCMDPQSDTVQRNFYNRVQIDNVDAFSVDGVAQTYTGDSGGRTYYPNDGSTSPNQVWPYIHLSSKLLGAGSYTLDLDSSIITSGSGRGVKFRRIMALSLEVVVAPPGGGSGSAALTERNEQIMYLYDYTAARRRVRVRVTDAAGAAITTAAGTQGAISKNGGVFTTTGVGVLVAEEASNGLYYAEFAQTALDQLGSYRYRVAAAGAALSSVVFPVEELPWIFDGSASGGGANFVDLASPPSYVQPGSVVRIVANTGAGQSMLALSYASPRVTMESTWDIAPDATSKVLIEPGLPLLIPDVNAVEIAGKALAATNLAEGAEAMAVGTVRAGANSPVQIVCDLPITVGGVATPANFWKDRGLVFKTGPLAGDQAIIAGSGVSGADTILALDPNSALVATPGVGVKFVVT